MLLIFTVLHHPLFPMWLSALTNLIYKPHHNELTSSLSSDKNTLRGYWPCVLYPWYSRKHYQIHTSTPIPLWHKTACHIPTEAYYQISQVPPHVPLLHASTRQHTPWESTPFTTSNTSDLSDCPADPPFTFCPPAPAQLPAPCNHTHVK